MRLIFTALAVISCTACDQIPLPGKISEADAHAIGAACRHAGRALEDCYQINPNASQAAVFAGWREMNDYMTEQKIEVVRPQLPPNLPKALRKKKKGDDTGTESEIRTDQSGPSEGQAATSAPDGAIPAAPSSAAAPSSGQ